MQVIPPTYHYNLRSQKTLLPRQALFSPIGSNTNPFILSSVVLSDSFSLERFGDKKKKKKEETAKPKLPENTKASRKRRELLKQLRQSLQRRNANTKSAWKQPSPRTRTEIPLNYIEQNIPYDFTVITHHGQIYQDRPLKKVKHTLQQAEVIVLGDLHGSYWKLLQTLLACNLLQVKPDNEEGKPFFKKVFLQSMQENADRLVAIVEKHGTFKTASQEDKQRFVTLENEMLDKIDRLERDGGTKRRLILLGDILADRGVSDRLTLALLEKIPLKQRIIVASNHDQAALHYWTSGQFKKGDPSSTYSLERALLYLGFPNAEKDSTTLRNALKAKYSQYFETLRLLHYDRVNRILCAHAPVTRAQITKLIIHLKQKYNWDNSLFPKAVNIYRENQPAEAASLIARINDFYRTIVTHQLIEKSDITDDVSLISETVNMRGKLNKQESLPHSLAAAITFIHGHDKQSNDSPFNSLQKNKKGNANVHKQRVINLDQECHKSPDNYGVKSELASNRLFVILPTKGKATEKAS